MNALSNAKLSVDRSEGDINWEGMLALSAQAQAYAAIAQAEQLKRIADALERYIGPAAPTNPERDDYIKNSVPGESLAEYQQRR